MILHRAAWVLPITASPVSDGVVAISENRIVAVGPCRDVLRDHPGEVVNHGDAILLPGLVNAHTHLEWSFLRGQVGPFSGFVDWMREITSRRKAASPGEIQDSILESVKEIRTTGTVAVGEVINNVSPATAASARHLEAAGLAAVVFVELIHFHPDQAEAILREGLGFLDTLRAQAPSLAFHLSPHAPYSVSPDLFRAIRARTERRTVHLAENEDEIRLLATGEGLWREILAERDRWDPGWAPPGVSPVRYLDDLGFLDERTLAVHVIRVSDEDIRILRRRKTPVCLCPRSNARLKVGRAPARQLFDAGLTVALGTDSLASNEDLSMFSEMRALRDQNPDLTAEEVVRAATLNGAIALGLESEFGCIAPGRPARLIGVRAGESGDPHEALLDEKSTIFFL